MRKSASYSLPELRESRRRFSILLEMIDMNPDSLDPQASDIHERLVMPAYESMRTEREPRWNAPSRRRFADTYRVVANKWPAYREALAELERARHLGVSVNDAMVRLERPRNDYITAMLTFYGEFTHILDFFFPL